MKIDQLKNLGLPNWLTIGRIAAVPVIVLLLQFGGGGKAVSIFTAVLFILAILTDLLDGYLARRYHQITNLGRFLDPLADKLLNLAALIMLIPMDRAAAWLVVLILGREMAVTGLRAIAASEGVVISASGLGKQKTVTQNVAIACLLWHYPLFGLNIHLIGVILLYAALAITYWSGLAYFKAFFRVLKGQNQEKLS
jgi:CDP-diacylglycerol--glycerol-3-phosphate 3-phosphatidyltransferase